MIGRAQGMRISLAVEGSPQDTQFISTAQLLCSEQDRTDAMTWMLLCKE